MTYKLNGTIFVYNPDDKKQAEELNLWYIKKSEYIFYLIHSLFFKSGLIILLRNPIYQRNVVYLLLQNKIKMKEAKVVIKANYVRYLFCIK